jgi:hypothetical protein
MLHRQHDNSYVLRHLLHFDNIVSSPPSCTIPVRVYVSHKIKKKISVWLIE